jgi:hypothetical protein
MVAAITIDRSKQHHTGTQMIMSAVKQEAKQLEHKITKLEEKLERASGGQEIELRIAIMNAQSQLRTLHNLIKKGDNK